MTEFLSKLLYTSDCQRVLHELNLLLECKTQWNSDNQIGLRHRPGCIDKWKDSSGSLYDNEKQVKISSECDFNIWNDECPSYTKQILEDLAIAEGISWGRVRFMLAMPKSGLSMHYDTEPRYHLVLQTNPNAIFAECFKNNNVRSIGYHMPADNHWYKVDTTREHFVYNGGWQPRIHLVCCPTV